MKQADDFFDTFCGQVNAEDFSAITRLFDYPVSIAYADPTRVYNSPPEIAELMRTQISEYRKAGVARIAVKVATDNRFEYGTHFVDVVWSFSDEKEDVLFKYPATYVLREDNDGNLKAIMFAGHDVEECCAYLKVCPDGTPIGVARH